MTPALERRPFLPSFLSLANDGRAAGVVNAVFIFITFLFTLPGLVTPARRWLKVAGIMAVFCGIFTLILGLYIWILTLKTRENFAPLFSAQSDEVKSLMQTAVCRPTSLLSQLISFLFFSPKKIFFRHQKN